jgi:GTP pyrophosphokinase
MLSKILLGVEYHEIPSGMDIQALLTKVQAYNPDSNLPRIQRAYDLACTAHAGQKRGTGDPYVSHCLATATILAELYMDDDTIIAGLLHDVPEDTKVLLDTIREQFGDEVSQLVDGVTKLSQLHLGMEPAEAESLRKMFLAMAEEIRVVLIKLADRLHNMRTLYGLDPAKQRKSRARRWKFMPHSRTALGFTISAASSKT